MSRGNVALKAKRQQTILSLVGRERLASQEEIRARLAALGLAATQSTISRDVEELGLARVHDHDGTRYVVPGQGTAPAPLRLLKHLLDGHTSVDELLRVTDVPKTVEAPAGKSKGKGKAKARGGASTAAPASRPVLPMSCRRGDR